MIKNPEKVIEKIARNIHSDLPTGVLDDYLDGTETRCYENNARASTVLDTAIQVCILDTSMPERLELIGRKPDDNLRWDVIYEALYEKLKAAVLKEHGKASLKHNKSHPTPKER